MEEKELVTSLIADHLRHMKFLSGFEKMGLDVLDHYLALPETILKIMKIENSETIFLYLIAASELACEKNREIKEVSKEIYDDLVQMRREISGIS